MAVPEQRRFDDPMLLALSASAGTIDAISWFALSKVFSAFMTGNFAFLAFLVAGAGGPPPVLVVVSIAAFGIGAALAGRMVAPAGRGGRTAFPVTMALCVVLVAHIAFLIMWLVVGGHPSTDSAHALIAVSAFGMGVQSAAAFALGRRVVFTTAVTASWTALMGEFSMSSTPSTRERPRLIGVIGRPVRRGRRRRLADGARPRLGTRPAPGRHRSRDRGSNHPRATPARGAGADGKSAAPPSDPVSTSAPVGRGAGRGLLSTSLRTAVGR